MKTVYLIRHGKSSWAEEGLDDKERPLKRRGERDAKLMAKVLRKKEIHPDYVVSSPANRALSTAGIFAKRLHFDEKKIAVSNLLYFEGTASMLKVIRELDDRHNLVFIFGHNPDFTEFANRFSSEPVDNVPTCGIVGIEFKIESWKNASFINGKMIFFDYPSQHK